jgi:hypothetical protein
MAIRTTAFINGQSASSRGIIYRFRGSKSAEGKSTTYSAELVQNLLIEPLALDRLLVKTPKGRFLFSLQISPE